MPEASIPPAVQLIAAFLSGGAFGAIITAIATGRREKRNRLRAFRESVSEIAAKINDATEDHLTEAYSSHREAVLLLCVRIHDDICAGVIQKFDAARDAFLGFLDEERERAGQHIAHTMFPRNPKPEPHGNRSRKGRMTDALADIIDCAR
jgi:hypothetical protein